MTTKASYSHLPSRQSTTKTTASNNQNQHLRNEKREYPSPPRYKSNRFHTFPPSLPHNEGECTPLPTRYEGIKFAIRRNIGTMDAIGGILRRRARWMWMMLRESWSIPCMNMNGDEKNFLMETHGKRFVCVQIFLWMKVSLLPSLCCTLVCGVLGLFCPPVNFHGVLRINQWLPPYHIERVGEHTLRNSKVQICGTHDAAAATSYLDAICTPHTTTTTTDENIGRNSSIYRKQLRCDTYGVLVPLKPRWRECFIEIGFLSWQRGTHPRDGASSGKATILHLIIFLDIFLWENMIPIEMRSKSKRTCDTDMA